MTIPYRTQRVLKRILGVLAVIAVVLAVVGGWLMMHPLWLRIISGKTAWQVK